MTTQDIKHALQGLLFLPKWWAQSWHKRDPYLWTFDSWQGTRYSDNPRALYEYILQNVPEIRCCWMTRNKSVYDRLKAEGKPVAMIDSKEGIRIQKDSGVFFATHGNLCGVSEGDIRYMNGIHYVNLWHGVPIKMVGDNERKFKQKESLYKRFKTLCRKHIVPWEFLSGTIVCGSSFFLPFMQSAFGTVYENILVTPEPRLDKLVQHSEDSLIGRLNERFGNPMKVLYMPTFRDTADGKFNPFLQPDFDASSLSQVLETNNIVLLYKGHYLDCHSKGITNMERIITISDADYDDQYSFIKDVDILITDYSSIYFDFICLRKPIILFPFDYEEYVRKSRPFFFDYNLMEAKRVFSWNELATCLQDKTYYVPTEEEVHRFRPQDIDGHCCEKIINILMKSLKDA